MREEVRPRKGSIKIIMKSNKKLTKINSIKLRALTTLVIPFITLSFMPVSVFAGADADDIDAVYINDLTTPVKDEALTFATIPENSNYTITSQYWYPSNETPESGITPESDNKIPDETKYYTYQIILTAKDGYKFPKWEDTTFFGGGIYINGTGDLIGVIDKELVSEDSKQLTLTMYKNKEVFAGIIDSVAVNDVILSYSIGDEPSATAKVPDDAHYTILYERWEEQNTDGTFAFWVSNDSYYIETMGKFSTFKKDSSYKYSVRVKADQGWEFEDEMASENITLNGENIDGFVSDYGTSKNKFMRISVSESMIPTPATEPEESEESSTTKTDDTETAIKAPETGLATNPTNSTSLKTSNIIGTILCGTLIFISGGIIIGATIVNRSKQ